MVLHICIDALTDVAGAEFGMYSCMCVLLAAARTESRMGPRLALTAVAQVPAWDAALVRPFLPQDLKLASHERESNQMSDREAHVGHPDIRLATSQCCCCNISNREEGYTHRYTADVPIDMNVQSGGCVSLQVSSVSETPTAGLRYSAAKDRPATAQTQRLSGQTSPATLAAPAPSARTPAPSAAPASVNAVSTASSCTRTNLMSTASSMQVEQVATAAQHSLDPSDVSGDNDHIQHAGVGRSLPFIVETDVSTYAVSRHHQRSGCWLIKCSQCLWPLRGAVYVRDCGPGYHYVVLMPNGRCTMLLAAVIPGPSGPDFERTAN